MSNSTSGVERAVHGALNYSELERLGLHPSEVLDFSVNCNPYGPSPRVRDAVVNAAIDRYPDCECLALRRAILDYELSAMGLPLDSIVCGNGTAELIWTIARTYLRPGLKAAILGPTFGEYRVACLAAGATVVEFQAQAAAYFQLDMLASSDWIRRERPSLVWLCNPNNPSGAWLDHYSIHLIAETCQRVGAIVVVDEAYWHFVFPPESYSTVELLDTSKNFQILVLRSLTKDFALAGLRLGYAIAPPDVAELLQAQVPAWNVNGIAQAAGIAALTDRIHLKTTLETLALERQAFFCALQDRGLKIVPSRTHFCLIEVGDAHQVRQELLMRKMLVRDCTSFGLPQFIRVATHPRSEWQHLLLALQEIV
jgi:histidinol-phosphate aminotransferase